MLHVFSKTYVSFDYRATLAARPTMFEPGRGSIVLPDRPGPRTTPGIGQPKDAAGFSRPFPPNRPGLANTAFPPIR